VSCSPFRTDAPADSDQSNLSDDSLEALVDALLDEIPEDNGSGVVITVKPESSPPPMSPSNQAKGQSEPKYDPSLVYILEYCTVLALRDDKTVELLGKRVVEALQAVLRDATRHHWILVGRVTFYLFSLLRASYVSLPVPLDGTSVDDRQDHDYVRVPVLLHSVSSLSTDTLRKTAEVVLQGIKLCIAEPGPLRSEIMTSPDFWVVLGTLASKPESAQTVFEILESGASGSPSSIISDNYEAAILLLNEFASGASVGAPAEQKQQDKKQPRKPTRPAKQPKARYAAPVLSLGEVTNLVCSDNVAVQRGIKAVNLIYNMTSRIPHLMKQSHLESNEGWYPIPLMA